MEFEVATHIDRPPAFVFKALTALDQVGRDPRSLVPVYEKTTPGPVAPGTKYREVVRMPLGFLWEVTSELTEVVPAERLSMTWAGPGMRGSITYHFRDDGGGCTHLRQCEWLEPLGLLRAASPLIRATFGRALESRIRSIKTGIEAGDFDAIVRPLP